MSRDWSRLVLATGNAHKVREVQEILAPLGIHVQTPNQVGGLPEVIEDGDTFADNALKKARSACAHTGLPALADDSGIEARALNWAPGVISARYAGEPGNDANNNAKLVAALSQHQDRYVQYRCVIALVHPDGTEATFSGTFAGEFQLRPAGEGGFGYDPYVLVPELGRTVAELPAAEKHARSHRGHALRACVAWLKADH